MGGQVITDDVQRRDDALMAVQVEEELTMIGDNVFELFDVGGWCDLGLLCGFGKIEPLFQTPEVVIYLLPVTLGAEWASQATSITN